MAKVDFCFGLCWQVAESLSNKSTNDKALVILTYFVVVLCHSLVILSETKYPFCHTCLALPTYFCHTERSEVSIKSKRVLNSVDISLTLNMTRVCCHCSTKMLFTRHCERAIRRAWQSTNLNANLPLDCHEFARSRFANSRNDKILVILINSFALT